MSAVGDFGRNLDQYQPAPVASASNSIFDSDHDFMEAEKESREKIVEVAEAYDAVIKTNCELDQIYKEQEESLSKALEAIEAELAEYREECKAEVLAANAGPSSRSGQSGQSHVQDEDEDDDDDFQYMGVGRPYFRDETGATPPDNEDTIAMKQFNMFDFSQVMTVSGWTVGDKSKLLSVLLDISKSNINNKLLTELSKLQKTENQTKAVTDKIAHIKKELTLLKKKTLDDLGLPEDQEFDWEEVAMRLHRCHLPQEYKSIWELFFHPIINKTSWSRQEHNKLQHIAAQKKFQNWEAIAKELNNNRTGYQCYVYFRTNVNHTATGRSWTQKELSYLKEVIEEYTEEGLIPWGRVAAAMNNRTKVQCYNKYVRLIAKRKGRFTPEEDAVILNFFDVYGPDYNKPYRKMTSYLPGRTAIQLRVRHNLLMKLRVSTTWTVEDDRKLIQIMANQDSRTNFSTATKHFPGKDRQHIRSRYLTLVRWIKSHPHHDIALAPRRSARRLIHGSPSANLIKALNNLRKKMNSDLEAHQNKVANAKGKNKISKDSSDNELHDAIMSTIANIEAANKQHEYCHVSTFQNARIANSYTRLTIGDISTTPNEKSNLFNMRNFLILLNANLGDKHKFYSSNIGKKFLEIEDMDREPDENFVNPQRIKSYSGKDKGGLSTVRTLAPLVKPDLFGTVTGSKKFLIPPNFATITASRVLLVHLTNLFSKDRQEGSEVNLKMLTRKNFSLNIHLTRLRERFIDLFTWPLVLSNDPPEVYRPVPVKRTSQKIQKSLGGDPGVAIPLIAKRLRLDENYQTSSNIDVQDSKKPQEINILLKKSFD